MEGTGDEVEVRVRDAFGTERKISYEYDFGAEWTHEITVQKTVPLDPGATYPVCVSFSGESPEEYPEEEDWESDEYNEDLEEDEDLEEAEEPAEREPFTLAAVNRKLAGLTERLSRCSR
jgi:hypothetical protein